MKTIHWTMQGALGLVRRAKEVQVYIFKERDASLRKALNKGVRLGLLKKTKVNASISAYTLQEGPWKKDDLETMLEKRATEACILKNQEQPKSLDLDPSVEASVQLARKALNAFRETMEDETMETVVSDLLTDLMHLCDAEGIEFDAVFSRAAANYEAEMP